MPKRRRRLVRLRKDSAPAIAEALSTGPRDLAGRAPGGTRNKQTPSAHPQLTSVGAATHKYVLGPKTFQSDGQAALRRWRLEPIGEQLLDDLGVGLAHRRLHHGSDQGVRGAPLAAPDLIGDVRVGGDDLVHDRSELTFI